MQKKTIFLLVQDEVFSRSMHCKKKYDLVLAVTNDLNSDRRMIRICNSIVQRNKKVLLIGAQNRNSRRLTSQPFDQHRLICLSSSGFLFYTEYNLRLFLTLLFLKAKTFCSVDLDTILAIRLASLIRGKSYAYDAHEHFTAVPELKERNFKKGIWKAIGKRCVKGASTCITVSESLAQILEKEFRNDFHVLRNFPYRKNLLPVNKSNNTFTLVYHGKINKGRGIKELIQSMENIENARLWIIGDGDLYEELQAFTKTFSFSGRIRFFGWVAPAELHGIISRAHLGVNLLDPESESYYYSLANKFFDYVMAGIPVLSMNFPEYQRINNQFEVAHLIDSLDKESIADAIKMIIRNENLLNEMKANCKMAREMYNWEKEEIKLLEIFELLHF